MQETICNKKRRLLRRNRKVKACSRKVIRGAKGIGCKGLTINVDKTKPMEVRTKRGVGRNWDTGNEALKLFEISTTSVVK